MKATFNIIVQALKKEYTILRDIYILIEETTSLTNLALENDDTNEVVLLVEQRQQYNLQIKERESEIRQVEEILKNLLGWDHFSMVRLLTEVESLYIDELRKITTEIQSIICSLARMDMVNYHLEQGKLAKDLERRKFASLRKQVEQAYLIIR